MIIIHNTQPTMQDLYIPCFNWNPLHTSYKIPTILHQNIPNTILPNLVANRIFHYGSVGQGYTIFQRRLPFSKLPSI